jgi:hypothetical protein
VRIQSLDVVEQGFSALLICLRLALRNALNAPRFSAAHATGSGCKVHFLAALSGVTACTSRAANTRKKIHLLFPGISKQTMALEKS